MSARSDQEIKDDMLRYIMTVLEPKREEFSGMPACPFVKADRVAGELFLAVYDNTKDTLLGMVDQFIASGKRSALLAQVNEDLGREETKEYQKFINALLIETGRGRIASLCFNPKDKLEVKGFNPRAAAPYFLINLAYSKDLSKAHRSLRGTKYYDNIPAYYMRYLGDTTAKDKEDENTSS
jgi:hypothetical protein